MRHGKLLLFRNIDTLKCYIKNESFEELKMWANEFENDEIGTISLNISKKIVVGNEILEDDICLWKEISLIIELYEDILYLNNNSDINKNLSAFKDIYNNNFIWKDGKKSSFFFSKAFRESIINIVEFIKKNTLIVE